MGSCVSVHEGSQESAMKLGISLDSKTDSLIVPPSPFKQKLSTASFNDFGSSKDETFFDSRVYLDSDCDDDFVSVNGDFTPSRGTTPVHHSFSMVTPQVNKVTENGSPGSVSESSPTGKKKRLSELFQESFRDDRDRSEVNASGDQDVPNEKIVKPTIQDILPPADSPDGTPYVSRANSLCSSERNANGDNPIGKEKPFRSTQRCLPSLVSCSSFGERKKKIYESPANLQ